MKITKVDEGNIADAGRIHSESWKESHRSFCSAEFVEKHTPAAQADFLRREINIGKTFYMLIDNYPVGIVSVYGSLIENLYVLPSEQRKGYGSQLLDYAIRHCSGTPCLWILNNNVGAYRLYSKNGFKVTGNRKQLNDTLYEMELSLCRLDEIRKAEAESHTQAYTSHSLFSPGSWLAKPVKTVIELLQLFEGYTQFAALDLGSGIGRNSIPVAQHFSGIPCRVDCVDILELAIAKLNENAQQYGAVNSIRGIVSAIDDYEITADSYDLVMAISALEHIASQSAFEKKLAEIRDGLRHGGIACLIINSGVIEHDNVTGQELLPQFEVNLPTSQMQDLLEKTFADWKVIKHTIVHQKYDIPRENGIADLETDVVTYVVRKELE